MKEQNLYPSAWRNLDPSEIRLVMHGFFEAAPGQRDGDPKTLHFPQAGSECEIECRFDDNGIVRVSKGISFTEDRWNELLASVDQALLHERGIVGRACSHTRFPVNGSWTGEVSGIQLMPWQRGHFTGDPGADRCPGTGPTWRHPRQIM